LHPVSYQDTLLRDQDIPSCREGDQVGRWSITVNENWRLTFTFEGTDMVLLDYEDYH
jgi:proteic killer suppression protein